MHDKDIKVTIPSKCISHIQCKLSAFAAFQWRYIFSAHELWKPESRTTLAQGSSSSEHPLGKPLYPIPAKIKIPRLQHQRNSYAAMEQNPHTNSTCNSKYTMLELSPTSDICSRLTETFGHIGFSEFLTFESSYHTRQSFTTKNITRLRIWHFCEE